MAEMAAQESLAPLQMKWPWVSRRALEMALSTLAHERADRVQVAAAYNALLNNYHSLKLQGAVIPEPVVVHPPKEPDPVIQQINTLSAGKPGLRAQMMKQLNTDRTIEQLDDVEIMRKIVMGVVNEEGVPA